jgi:hypothetical protein
LVPTSWSSLRKVIISSETMAWISTRIAGFERSFGASVCRLLLSLSVILMSSHSRFAERLGEQISKVWSMLPWKWLTLWEPWPKFTSKPRSLESLIGHSHSQTCFNQSKIRDRVVL